MNPLKLITISITIVISLIVLLLMIYLLTKNFKSRIDNDGKLKLSFGIWYSAIFLSGANIISSIIQAVFETIDNLIKIQPVRLYLEIVKSLSLIVGVAFVWLVIWFFVIKFLTKIIPIRLNEQEEMEDDNFSYFLIKGVILIGVIFSLSSVLSLILRSLIPNVEIPFYH